jgi:hypothetical protein
MKSILFLSILMLSLFCSDAQREPQVNKRDSELQEKTVIVNGNDTLTIPLNQEYIHINDIPPRYQWEHNAGYCGEVSLISAGLYYGQYLSQYDVREIICGKGKQKNCEMLLGDNASAGAESLRLKHEKKTTKNSKDFLKWVKNHVLQGHPVIIGVMNNENLLYGKTNPSAGQPDYDHIVPVIGIGSNEPFSTDYKASDVILFSDNGLVTNGPNPARPKNGTVPYYYDYSFEHFVGDRQQANKSDGHHYTLIDLPQYDQGDNINNYGIAILGIDGEQETLPVRVSTNLNYEAPYIRSKSNKRPRPMSLTLTVKVSKLVAGAKYYLYQYDNEMDVPRSDFNKNSKLYKKRTEIKLSSGSEFSMSLDITSNEKVFFRCVKAE